MTRFKLDENLPQAATAVLVSAGHDVHTAQSEGLAGQADDLIVKRCQAEGRVLVTLDLDFADIRLYPPATMPGVWVLRPRLQSTPAIVALLEGAVRLLPTEPIEHSLWVIGDTRVRIRT